MSDPALSGLAPLDAALILHANGGQTVLLPDPSNGGMAVGENVILITALATRLTEDAFVLECLAWLEGHLKGRASRLGLGQPEGADASPKGEGA